MNSLRKFNNSLSNFFLTDFFDLPDFTIRSRGQWVDTDRYDIVPRKSYIDELIKQKEDDIAYHEEKIKVLKEEISRLGKQKQG